MRRVGKPVSDRPGRGKVHKAREPEIRRHGISFTSGLSLALLLVAILAVIDRLRQGTIVAGADHHPLDAFYLFSACVALHNLGQEG